MPVFYADANGQSAGEFRADSAEDVRRHLADMAGFSSWSELVAQGGGDDKLNIIPIDTEALVRAVESQTKDAIFEDAFGNGVALINNQSFSSYDDLAQLIGKRVWDFPADTQPTTV